MFRICTLTVVLFAIAWPSRAERVTLPFDAGWRFLKTDAPGADQPAFDDTAWRHLDVPHDWSIEGPFSPTNKTGGAGGFLPSGVAWYRKAFTLPANASNQCVFIEFDGVMANSDVWINGQWLGHRPNGYVSFRYELTGDLRFGPKATNVVAVRTDTSAQPASRWYTGAGVYRHVRLILTAPAHLEPDGVFVSTPAVSETQATVRVTGVVTNAFAADRDVVVDITLRDPRGDLVQNHRSEPIQLQAPEAAEFRQEFQVNRPERWDVDHPALYLAEVRVRSGTNLLDDLSVKFGIRDARFTPDRGFVLNGRKVMLKGGCLHHDGGAVGAAVPLSLWEDRLKALRALGCNAIRTSHNPVAPEFLDLCDRLGFLVMDEFFDCWTVGKKPHDYHLYFEDWSLIDLRDTVRRDRNHPSIVIYSAGNEIRDTPRPERAKRILAGLVEAYHANDPTRPVTQGLFRPNSSGDYTNGLADLLDVVGTNYRDRELLDAQRARPDRRIVGTEQRHDRETWLYCRDHPSHSGQFLWTGVDYLGEARHWPRNAFASGLLDRTGWIKPQAYQRQSWWTDAPMVRIARRVAPDDVLPEDPGYGGEERFTQVTFSDWSPRNREPHPENVEVYSNCEEVELLLNGRSLGSEARPENASPRRWQVSFEPGTLEAVGRNGGHEVARHALQTAGSPVKLTVTVDRPSLSPAWDDVAVVRVEVTDPRGVRCPFADDLITFDLIGPGKLVAVDNGDCMSTEPFQASQRRAYGGRCVAIVRATAADGSLVLRASADSLEGDEATIHLRPVAP